MDDYIARRKPSLSSDKFSFPPPPSDPDQFQFGYSAPGSPNSPADHLFSNGKLLPHVFPIPYNNNSNNSNCYYNYSRSTSRTSSSRDSLMSSRSNSISSNCSSARTSDVAAHERKPIPLPPPPRPSSGDRTRSPGRNRGRPAAAPAYYYCHGSSQRWQLIAAAPVLCRQESCRSSRKSDTKLDRKGSKRTDDRGATGRAKSSFGRRLLKSFVSACKECHAIQSTGAVEL